MQVYCPECNTGYEIDPALIPEEGKKLRCASCGHVWLCLPADVVDVDKKNNKPEKKEQSGIVEKLPEIEISEEIEVEVMPEPQVEKPAQATDTTTEMQEIFARLSAQSETIFKAEQEIPPYKKALKNIQSFLGLRSKKVCCGYLLTFITLGALGLNYARYEIVRKFPSMEKIYSSFGIESRIVGEGLEFRNVTRRDFEEDYVNKTEVKGYIVNTTSKDIALPTIHLNMLDADGKALQEVNSRLLDTKVVGDGQLAFSIIVVKPSPLSKYIFLTFINDKK